MKKPSDPLILFSSSSWQKSNSNIHDDKWWKEVDVVLPCCWRRTKGHSDSSQYCNFPFFSLLSFPIHLGNRNDGTIHITKEKPTQRLESRAVCEQINKQTANETIMVVEQTTGWYVANIFRWIIYLYSDSSHFACIWKHFRVMQRDILHLFHILLLLLFLNDCSLFHLFSFMTFPLSLVSWFAV